MKKRYSEEQIIKVIKQHEAGANMLVKAPNLMRHTTRKKVWLG